MSIDAIIAATRENDDFFLFAHDFYVSGKLYFLHFYLHSMAAEVPAFPNRPSNRWQIVY